MIGPTFFRMLVLGSDFMFVWLSVIPVTVFLRAILKTTEVLGLLQLQSLLDERSSKNSNKSSGADTALRIWISFKENYSDKKHKSS